MLFLTIVNSQYSSILIGFFRLEPFFHRNGAFEYCEYLNHGCDELDKVYLPCLKADIVEKYKQLLVKYNSEVDGLDIPKCSFKKGSDKLMAKVVRHIPSDEMRCECAVSRPCKLLP